MNNKLTNMPNEFFYLCGIYSGLKNMLDACNETIEKNPTVFTDEIIKHKLFIDTTENIIKSTTERLNNEFSVDINDIIGVL